MRNIGVHWPLAKTTGAVAARLGYFRARPTRLDVALGQLPATSARHLDNAPRHAELRRAYTFIISVPISSFTLRSSHELAKARKKIFIGLFLIFLCVCFFFNGRFDCWSAITKTLRRWQSSDNYPRSANEFSQRCIPSRVSNWTPGCSCSKIIERSRLEISEKRARVYPHSKAAATPFRNCGIISAERPNRRVVEIEIWAISVPVQLHPMGST